MAMSAHQNANSRNAPFSRRGIGDDQSPPQRSRTTMSFQELAQRSNETQSRSRVKVSAYELTWDMLRDWLLHRFRDDPATTFEERVSSNNDWFVLDLPEPLTDVSVSAAMLLNVWAEIY
jgi:hypothetical protein